MTETLWLAPRVPLWIGLLLYMPVVFIIEEKKNVSNRRKKNDFGESDTTPKANQELK